MSRVTTIISVLTDKEILFFDLCPDSSDNAKNCPKVVDSFGDKDDNLISSEFSSVLNGHPTDPSKN